MFNFFNNLPPPYNIVPAQLDNLDICTETSTKDIPNYGYEIADYKTSCDLEKNSWTAWGRTFTLAATAMGATSLYLPLGAVAAIGVSIAIYSISNRVATHFRETLNPSTDRDVIINRLANQSFSEIATSQYANHVIGHALLDTPKRLENGSEALNQLYCKFAELQNEFARVNNRKDGFLRAVNSTYMLKGGKSIPVSAIDASGNEVTILTYPKSSKDQWFWQWKFFDQETRLADWREDAVSKIENDYAQNVQKINLAFKNQINFISMKPT